MSVAIIGGAIGGVGVQYPLASGACVVQGTTLVDVPFKHLMEILFPVPLGNNSYCDLSLECLLCPE